VEAVVLEPAGGLFVWQAVVNALADGGQADSVLGGEGG
jgi:hypothetical protein